MLTNGKSKAVMNYFGCSCHNTKRLRRAVKKSSKRREERNIRREVW